MVTTIFWSIFFGGITLKKMTPLRTVLPAHRTLGPWCGGIGPVKGFHGGWKVTFQITLRKDSLWCRKMGFRKSFRSPFHFKTFWWPFYLYRLNTAFFCVVYSWYLLKVACKHHSKEAFLSQQSEVCSCSLRFEFLSGAHCPTNSLNLFRSAFSHCIIRISELLNVLKHGGLLVIAYIFWVSLTSSQE